MLLKRLSPWFRHLSEKWARQRKRCPIFVFIEYMKLVQDARWTHGGARWRLELVLGEERRQRRVCLIRSVNFHHFLSFDSVSVACGAFQVTRADRRSLYMSMLLHAVVGQLPLPVSRVQKISESFTVPPREKSCRFRSSHRLVRPFVALKSTQQRFGRFVQVR